MVHDQSIMFAIKMESTYSEDRLGDLCFLLERLQDTENFLSDGTDAPKLEQINC